MGKDEYSRSYGETEFKRVRSKKVYDYIVFTLTHGEDLTITVKDVKEAMKYIQAVLNQR